MEAKGAYVTVTFDGATVHFRSKKVDRDFSVAQIASVDFQPASIAQQGYIHFRAAGDTYKVGKGPNAAHFRKSENEAFRALADAVRAATARVGSTPVAAAAPSSPAESDIVSTLQRLGELRDAGVVSAEEFEAKKAELLSRL